jgi:hypothetical protein
MGNKHIWNTYIHTLKRTLFGESNKKWKLRSVQLFSRYHHNSFLSFQFLAAVIRAVITALLHLLTLLLTYLLIPWRGVLLDKLTGFQLVKKFPLFYGTPRLITAFTKLFPTGFPTKTLYTSLLFPIRATCPTHLILIQLYYTTGK